MTCFDEEPDGDIHGECAAEIHRLQSQVEQLQADNARLREAFYKVSLYVESCIEMQQPNFDEPPDYVSQFDYDLAQMVAEMQRTLASTDSSNWLAEHDAEVQLRILDACWNTVSANQCWEIAAKLGIDIDKLRRMAASPKVEPDKLVNPAGY